MHKTGKDSTCVRSWAKFLNPDTLRSNLIAASLFLAAYETLRNSVVAHIRDFFCFGFDEAGDRVSPKYQHEILSRNSSPLRASLSWLRERDVIDDADIELIDRIRQHRNELAHDLPRFVATDRAEVNQDLLASIYGLVAKIDRWWIREVEIPTNPDFDDLDIQSIDDNEIQSGNMMFLQLMIRIATSDDSESTQWYDHLVQSVARRD